MPSHVPNRSGVILAAAMTKGHPGAAIEVPAGPDHDTRPRKLLYLCSTILYSVAATVAPGAFVAHGFHPTDISSCHPDHRNSFVGPRPRGQGQTSNWPGHWRLIDLTPKRATVRRGSAELDLPLEQIVSGDRVIVRPGQRIPATESLPSGSTSVDQSMVTGESMRSREALAPASSGVR